MARGLLYKEPETGNSGVGRCQDGQLQPLLSVEVLLQQHCQVVVSLCVTFAGLCQGHWTTITFATAIC
jgi:hypothetical protein